MNHLLSLKGNLEDNGISIAENDYLNLGKKILFTYMDRDVYDQMSRVNVDPIEFHVEYFAVELSKVLPSNISVISADFQSNPLIVLGQRVQRIQLTFVFSYSA